MSYVRGYFGQYLNYFKPDEYKYEISEFAFALSKLCRFTGHVHTHYSVAQHSVLVSRLVGDDPEVQLQALLHDAPEAFMADIPSPLKAIIGPEYNRIELCVLAAIMRQWDLPIELPESIEIADKSLLVVERRDLIPKDDADGWSSIYWPKSAMVTIIHPEIIPLTHQAANMLFMERAIEILGQRK